MMHFRKPSRKRRNNLPESFEMFQDIIEALDELAIVVEIRDLVRVAPERRSSSIPCSSA